MDREIREELAVLREGQKFILQRLEVLEKKLEARIAINGEQDVSLTRLEERVRHLDSRIETFSRRMWGLIAGVILAILQGLVGWLWR